MSKRYRPKNAKVIAITYGHAAYEQNFVMTPNEIAKVLKGKTPEQHCKSLITKEGEYFSKESEEQDICYLFTPTYFNPNPKHPGPEYRYTYHMCETLEWTISINHQQCVNEKALKQLQGGEHIEIVANQAVTWQVANSKLLDKINSTNNTYAFTMPKTGSFSIKAIGHCDSDARKIAVLAVAAKSQKPTTKTQTIALSEQDIHDLIKVVSTEVDTGKVKDLEKRKQQTQGVIDTILNRMYLDKNHDLRAVVNKPWQFSAINAGSNTPGSVQKLSDSRINPWVAQYTEEYLQQRVKSSKSSVGGNFNYFNPNASKPSWGNDVKEQAIRNHMVFGEGKAIHYHGTAKGERQAPEFTITLPKGYIEME